MSLARKDYEAIADVLERHSRLRAGNPIQQAAVLGVTISLAEIFAEGNDLFSPSKFLAASGATRIMNGNADGGVLADGSAYRVLREVKA